jgi:hypothetical protein
MGFKLQKTDMSKLRAKQRRASKGVSEYQHFSDPKSQGDEPRVEYNMKSAAPFKMKGNPLKRNFDFKSKKKKIDFGKTRDFGATWDELEQDRANPEVVKSEGTSLEQRRLREARGMR